MHRISGSSLLEVTNQSFRMRLVTPVHHVPLLTARCHGTAIQAALEVAGAWIP